MSTPKIERTSVESSPVFSAPAPPLATPAPVAAPADGYRATTIQPLRRVSTFSRITPSRGVTAIAGIGLLTIGLIAMAKAGLSTPLDTPVVTVAGMTHTAWLGIIGAGAGLVLLFVATAAPEATSRSGSILFGTIIGIGGVVGISTPKSFHSLALQSSYGWMVLIGAVVVVAANMFLPTITTSRVSSH
jgi:hypothetical protein